MIVVDAHCDSLTRVVNNNKSLIRNSYHWDVSRALRYDGFVQVLAVFQNPDKKRPTFKDAMMYINEAKKIDAQNLTIKLCNKFKDIEDGLKAKKVCCLLSIEGGEALEGKVENLNAFFDAGVRLLTLTWNYANELGDGAQTQQNGGLTPFGVEIVKLMQQKGMIIDISHSDEKTFEDCISICKAPIIASHSNTRAICEHPRNLYDWQIEAIKATGGVVGVNFYTEFINNSEKACVSSLVRHIEHVCEVAGPDTVGIGADFDGMNSLPDPINGVEHLYLVFNELGKLNYTDETIKKIAGENFTRVFSEDIQ